LSVGQSSGSGRGWFRHLLTLPDEGLNDGCTARASRDVTTWSVRLLRHAVHLNLRSFSGLSPWPASMIAFKSANYLMKATPAPDRAKSHWAACCGLSTNQSPHHVPHGIFNHTRGDRERFQPCSIVSMVCTSQCITSPPPAPAVD
jgi:hypothetical protein